MINTLLDNIENLCILLVDDEPFMQQFLENVLINLGFENIKKADDGQQALKILGEEKIDLLLTDIQMPVMNGLELMKTIRSGKSPTSRNLCTIIVTSFTNTETLGSAMAMDFNGFLTKPFKPVTVMKTIMQALSEKDTELREDNSYLEVKTDLDSLQAEAQAPTEAPAEETSAEEGSKKGQAVNVHQLQANMRLTKDVKTEKGVLLLSAGFVLTKNTISRLIELDAIITNSEFHVELIEE